MMKILIGGLMLFIVPQLVIAATVTINDPATSSGYEVDEYNSQVVQDVDLVLIGIYEADSGHGPGYHPTYPANVTINNGGNKPITLVLSSYEPVRWNITADQNVEIREIILVGYHTHEFTGVGSSLVTDKSGGNRGEFEPCGYSYPYNGQGCDTDSLIEQVEDYTGLSLSVFSGVYRASDFTVTTGVGDSVQYYPYIATVSLPDINGNSYPELATLRVNPNGKNCVVYIKDRVVGQTCCAV